MAATDSDPRLDHMELLNRYCHALDFRDWDLLRSLFTEDAIFSARMVNRGVPGPDDAYIEGRDALVDNLIGIWEHLASTHHMVSNHVIEVAPDGRSAKGSCYLRAYHAGWGDKSHLFEESLGRFDFETVREGGSWRIRRWDEKIFVMLGSRQVFGHD